MKATLTTLALSVALIVGCSNEPKTAGAVPGTTDGAPAAATAAASEMTPEQLGELGARIEKEPAKAEELLSQQGLDMKSFEKRIREVTENPDASKRYAEAYRRASA